MSHSLKQEVALMREWAKLHQEITAKDDEDTSYYYTPPSPGPTTKSQALVGMNRRTSEEDEDRFSNLYTMHGLIEPVWSFHLLWRLREQSDTLTSCIRSLVKNCALPNDFEFAGDDKSEKQSDKNQAILKSLRQFFSRVNEKESFLTLHDKVQDDLETTGNGFIEVLRNFKGFVERLYYSPSTHMRISRLDDDDTPITLKIPREGELKTVTWGRRFRRFARIDISTNVLYWFKELGDPRVVDAKTGEYVKDTQGDYVLEKSSLGASYPNKATEIWWFSYPYSGEPYGLPRWIPALHNVVGRYIAQWINKNHLDKGAIPPFALVPKGGSFTPAQIKMIREILQGWKTPGTYNDPIILDLKPHKMFHFDRGSSNAQTGVELIKMRDPKDEDYMFANYLKATEDAIRKIFLLPPPYIGESYSDVYTAIEIAENQIFEPEKRNFDEKVTTELLQQEFDVYDWRYKTKGSKINDREVHYRAANTVARNGGTSINQEIELANEMFGTDFSPHKGGALYNEPFALVRQVVSPANMELREDGFHYINPQPAPELSLGLPSDLLTAETPQEQQTPEVPITKEESTVEQDTRDLLEIMARIEERGYQAPVITEAHYEL